jgi:hypothetical protein
LNIQKSSMANMVKKKSSICLSPDRSIASSKLSSPKSAILSFLLGGYDAELKTYLINLM